MLAPSEIGSKAPSPVQSFGWPGVIANWRIVPSAPYSSGAMAIERR
jgi:hypothetical protein